MGDYNKIDKSYQYLVTIDYVIKFVILLTNIDDGNPNMSSINIAP